MGDPGSGSSAGWGAGITLNMARLSMTGFYPPIMSLYMVQWRHTHGRVLIQINDESNSFQELSTNCSSALKAVAIPCITALSSNPS